MSKHAHPNSTHPATGLLECDYVDQAGDTSRGEAGICGKDGFDLAWHKLKASDYTGATPRPGDWAKLLEKKDPDQAKKEAKAH